MVRAVEDLGKRDNTLIIYISGDNGPSAEGSPNGTPNEMTFFNGVEVPVAAQMKFLGARGTVPFKLDGQRVIFQPLNSLGVGETVTLLVDVEAVKPGVAVFQAEVSGGPLQKPVVKEEATTVR